MDKKNVSENSLNIINENEMLKKKVEALLMENLDLKHQVTELSLSLRYKETIGEDKINQLAEFDYDDLKEESSSDESETNVLQYSDTENSYKEDSDNDN
uniref:Uncharacterized protein n=1 Tax=viral metagenome TaxID=1070528 RepID=A0A6C0JPI6_9ZZZZ